jgi:hypothetical protein
MLDDMVVDYKLPIRPDAASAVIVTNKSGAFKPELIGEDANFGNRDVTYRAVGSSPPEAKITTSAIMNVGTPAEGITTRAGMQRSY